MKNIINKLVLLSATMVVLFASCKKDDKNKITYQETNATATLVSSATAVVLTESTAKEQVIEFSWAKPSYGYNASVTYSLQFDVPSDSFQTPQLVPVGVDVNSEGMTGGDINQLASKLKMQADTIGILQVRLVAEVKQNGGGGSGSATLIAPVYSEPIDVKITPYSSEVVYPSIYAVGAFQGWNPAEGIQLFSVNSDDKYEGYINVSGASGGDLEFKFTAQPDWGGTNYGSGADPTTAGFVTSGTLSTDGGAGNLKVPAGGYYRIKANTTALTFEAYQTVWGLIGSATPSGWDASTPMTYDAVDKVWVIESVALSAGEIKFRANDAWDLSYGADASGAKLTTDNGANIAVAGAGNYKVVLDLSNSTNYHYTLTKL